MAKTIHKLGVSSVIDIGCNINAVLKNSSLRTKLENFGIKYWGLDLDKSYFSADFISRMADNSVEVFDTINGEVGDINKLKYADRSIECITALDVLEHLDNSNKSLKEVARVLKPNGYAIFVLPSLYKLDLFNFHHIENIRKSSHLSKKTILDWDKEISESGLVQIPSKNSPIGILSGISYLLWGDPKFVPNRTKKSGLLKYSPYSEKHERIKNVFCQFDSITDPILQKLLLQDRDFSKLTQELNVLLEVLSTIDHTEVVKQNLSLFIKLLKELDWEEEVLSTIKLISKLPVYAFANSTMLVYKSVK